MEPIPWDIREAITLKRAQIIAFEIINPNFENAKNRIDKKILHDVEDRFCHFMARLNRQIDDLRSGDISRKRNITKKVKTDLAKTFPDARIGKVASIIGVQVTRFRQALTSVTLAERRGSYRCQCALPGEGAQIAPELRWLGEIYKFCEYVVAKYYCDILDTLNVRQREYCFHTSIKAGLRPHGFRHDSHVDGVTKYYPGMPTQITVYLPVFFDKISYLTLPFVIFHEAVCHAHQRAGAKDSLPRERNAHCRFAEGWMDSLALLMFEIALTDLKGHAPEEMKIAADDMTLEAREFHKSRKDKNGDGGKDRSVGAVASVNARVAIWYHDHVFGDGTLSSEAWSKKSIEIFFQFSFLINILAGKAEIDEILGQIDRLVPTTVKTPESRAFAELVDELLKTRDLKTFIEHLKCVPTEGGYFERHI